MKTLLKLDPSAPYVYKVVGTVELSDSFAFSGIDNIETVDEELRGGSSVIYDPSARGKVYKLTATPTGNQARDAWHHYGFILGYTDKRDGTNRWGDQTCPNVDCHAAFDAGRIEGEEEYASELADDEAQGRADAQFEADYGQH